MKFKFKKSILLSLIPLSVITVVSSVSCGYECDWDTLQKEIKKFKKESETKYITNEYDKFNEIFTKFYNFNIDMKNQIDAEPFKPTNAYNQTNNNTNNITKSFVSCTFKDLFTVFKKWAKKPSNITQEVKDLIFYVERFYTTQKIKKNLKSLDSEYKEAQRINNYSQVVFLEKIQTIKSLLSDFESSAYFKDEDKNGDEYKKIIEEIDRLSTIINNHKQQKNTILKK